MIAMRLATAGLVLLARAACEAQDLPLGVRAGRRVLAPGPLVAITIQWDRSVAGPVDVFRFEREPGERVWRAAGDRPVSAGQDRATTIEGPAGVESLVVVRARDRPAYLLDGPFRWPTSPVVRFLNADWRRTIRGSFAARGVSLAWVDGDADRRVSAWPVCEWLAAEAWECIGVPAAASGVVVSPAPAAVSYAIVRSGSGGEAAAWASAPVWGRLVVVQATDQSGANRISAAPRRVYVPKSRGQPVRLETETDTRIQVHAVEDRAFWVSGSQPAAADSWIDVAAKGAAAERIDASELAAGSPEVPFRVQLEPAASITGWVRAADGSPAPGAVVAIYRVEAARGAPARPRRIAAGEATAGADGEFVFDDLSRDRFEIVVWHPTYGRGVAAATADTHDFEIRLRPAAHIVGRVVRAGEPAAGVPVVFLPDATEFAAGGDPTELRGGETTSGRDGRFRVAASVRGAAELRIGDARAGVRRLPLGPAESLPGVVDVGVIELGGVPPVTFVLEGAEECDLVVAGPSGRLGLAVVTAVRVGPAMYEASVPEAGKWQVVAVCGPLERAVVPGIVEFPATGTSRTIRLVWPR